MATESKFVLDFDQLEPNSLLGKLFLPLIPALDHQADEIRIQLNCAESAPVLSAEYSKDNTTMLLEFSPEIHPFIMASRLKIIAHVSIASNAGDQKGSIPIRFRSKLIEAPTSFSQNGDRELVIITLNPTANNALHVRTRSGTPRPT
jgi:hypothetical protein